MMDDVIPLYSACVPKALYPEFDNQNIPNSMKRHTDSTFNRYAEVLEVCFCKIASNICFVSNACFMG